MKESDKISAMLSKSWKKSFDRRFVTPAKMRFYKECNDKSFVIV